MNNLIRSAIRNTPAMNTLMVAILAAGILSLFSLRREVFPEFELEIILVTVPYPGASPDEVESGICEKIEEAVRSIEGIKKQTAIAKEGAGTLVLELQAGTNAQKILNEVRSEIDRIPSFPVLAEDPEVKQLTIRQPAITVGVVGPDQDSPDSELRLREVAESVREDLLRLPAVSQADISGAKDYQIDVEINEETLRRYGLSLQRVAEIIRAENLELPGGTIRTQSQEILIKGKNKRLLGEEIAKIPLVSQPDGTVLTVKDLGHVRDEFTDNDIYTRIDGKPGMAIAVTRSSTEDLLAMTDSIHNYVNTHQMPAGYSLLIWGDQSVEVRDRINLLLENGVQGLILVVIFLSLFLNLTLSWWVALGIPISILGACSVLFLGGQTLNMLTTFTFVMALGIVVDDAIIIGENIYTHRKMGKLPLQAAIDGTLEVSTAVISAIVTTIIAFVPLLFVTGVMGKFIAVMPITMIAILLFSLFESLFILPCHLAHESDPNDRRSLAGKSRSFLSRMPWMVSLFLAPPLILLASVLDLFVYPVRRLSQLVDWLNQGTNTFLDWFCQRIYIPLMKVAFHNVAAVLCAAMSLLLLAGGVIAGGIVPFVVFPKTDSNTIDARIVYPDGTPTVVTDEGTKRLEEAVRAVNERLSQNGESVIKLVRRAVGFSTSAGGPIQMGDSSGSHLGLVTVELTDVAQRSLDCHQIINLWRAESGTFPGAESVTFSSGDHGPGGKPIEFKLLAQGQFSEQLELAVEQTKQKLSQFPGVFDIQDDSTSGKWEFQLQIKDKAVATGVSLEELAKTVRAAYYGEEVMRLQRGRHEVKLMVRFPRDDRRSLADFDQIRVRTSDGSEHPLTELAEVKISRGYSEINRVDQLRSITISADLDETQANASEIVQALRREFMPQLFQTYPELSVLWEGQQQQTTESVESLIIGLGIALIAMFVLLTLQFTSYIQPLIILAIIPFGFVGAVFGHAVMGLPLTLFSLFGLVTLSGVVINDSIVLIDFINQRRTSGLELTELLIQSGVRRLRPILLTSVTTIGGLFPLILETSFQAQILIPMAVSICFGLIVSTALVVILIPVFYYILAHLEPASHDHAEPEVGSESQTNLLQASSSV